MIYHQFDKIIIMKDFLGTNVKLDSVDTEKIISMIIISWNISSTDHFMIIIIRNVKHSIIVFIIVSPTTVSPASAGMQTKNISHNLKIMTLDYDNMISTCIMT